MSKSCGLRNSLPTAPPAESLAQCIQFQIQVEHAGQLIAMADLRSSLVQEENKRQ